MTCFSESYQQARERFLQASSAAGGSINSTELDTDLAVDVAVINQSAGTPSKATLIVSSGLHGVEGFFGSAVQLSLLQQLERFPDIRIVLVHALNPWGFAHLRRGDKDNIDLNRNFLPAEDKYHSAPSAYKKLNGFLNPQSPPTALEPYRLKALYNILRYGMPALKDAIVGGQYDYPCGIFFGGHASAVTTEFVKRHCDEWAADAETILHLDLHTGLGNFGEYKLLLEHPDPADYGWFVETFGEQALGSLQHADDTAYVVSGSMGGWLKEHFKHRRYYFAGVEFGTYGPVRVLGAIRAENRAHYYADERSRANRVAKNELLECFCPASEQWRNRVVDSSLKIISSAREGLLQARATGGDQG